MIVIAATLEKTSLGTAYQKCIAPDCGATYGIDDARVACAACGGLLDVTYDWDRARPPTSLAFFEKKWANRLDPLCFSGVWRFHELLPFAPPEKIVTIGEGQTLLHSSIAQECASRSTRLLSRGSESSRPSWQSQWSLVQQSVESSMDSSKES